MNVDSSPQSHSGRRNWATGLWQLDHRPAAALIGQCVKVPGRRPSISTAPGRCNHGLTQQCLLRPSCSRCCSSMNCAESLMFYLLCVLLSINHNLWIHRSMWFCQHHAEFCEASLPSPLLHAGHTMVEIARLMSGYRPAPNPCQKPLGGGWRVAVWNQRWFWGPWPPISQLSGCCLPATPLSLDCHRTTSKCVLLM